MLTKVIAYVLSLIKVLGVLCRTELRFQIMLYTLSHNAISDNNLFLLIDEQICPCRRQYYMRTRTSHTYVQLFKIETGRLL